MSEINLKLKTYDELTFEISRLNIDKYLLEQKLEKREKQIQDAIEYIENNSLYEQDYDYDYEENLVEYPPTDEYARNDLLKILKL